MINIEKLILENDSLKAINNHLRDAFGDIRTLADEILNGQQASDVLAMRIMSVADTAIAATPAESLQAFENELIEKCAKVCNDMLERRGVTFDHKFMADTCAYAIRALKEVK